MQNDKLEEALDGTCVDTVQWVSQMRDRELSVEDKRRFDRHLQSCQRCQAARRQFEALFTGLDEVLARSW